MICLDTAILENQNSYKLIINPLLVYLLNYLAETQQGKPEGFDSCDWPSNIAQIVFKSTKLPICRLVGLSNLTDDFAKQ